MRAFISFLLMTFAVGLLADETITNRVTPEFLTSRGFVQSKSDTNIFTLERVTVREASKRLGFSPDQMRHTPSQPPHSDVRIVKVLNLWFVVSSEVRDSQDRVVSGSLDKPDAICTVSVGLTQAPDTRKMTPKGKQPSKGAAAPNRRPAGQLDGSDNLFATLPADRALPAAVAELGLGRFAI